MTPISAIVFVSVLWTFGGPSPTVNTTIMPTLQKCEKLKAGFYEAVKSMNDRLQPASFWFRGSAQCIPALSTVTAGKVNRDF